MITKQRFCERIGGHEKTKHELDAEDREMQVSFGSAGTFGDGRDDTE